MYVCVRGGLGSRHHACALHLFICKAGLPGALLVCFNPSISLLHFITLSTMLTIQNTHSECNKSAAACSRS